MMSSGAERTAQVLERATQFALRIVRMYSVLRKSVVAQTLGKQVLRSGTSIGAQCREARRARSTKEFVSKLQGAIQEADETQYWLELLVKSEVVPEQKMTALLQETNEIIAILTSVVKRQSRRPS